MINTNEMKNRAYEFVDIHKDSSDEKQMAQMWVRDFYRVFDVPYQKVRIGFEWRVNIDGKTKFVDHLINGLLLIEMKSRGKSLDKAQSQAYKYVMNLNKEDLPRYIMISDFERIRLYDLKIDDEKNYYEFRMEDLPKNLELFNFLIGKQLNVSIPQNPVNVKAAKLMESLHIKLLKAKYPPNYTNLLMTRLVFCLFAEDSDIFKKNQFSNFIKNHTREDGSDLVTQIATLFEVLNTPYEDRYQIGDLNDFPYINGGLFKIPQKTGLMLTSEIRELLLITSNLDWSKISPVIFGSMFEGAMDKEKRHNLGAHYTSEKNIMKVINGLFLEELIENFEDIKNLRRGKDKALSEFHIELSQLKFLDPACGSGNFLLVAYRELRRLEHQVIDEIQRGQTVMDISELIKVEVNQFYGIEIEAYAVSIAKLSLWIMDHLMNLEASELFGQHYVRLPLHASANIVNEDALIYQWDELVHPFELNYILGNPPFIGASNMNVKQKKILKSLGSNLKGISSIDYVGGWYLKSVEFIKKNENIIISLVSTNSLFQGTQAIFMANVLKTHKLNISFAHQTFNWDNNGANVHVVIVGMEKQNRKNKSLYTYENIRKEPKVNKVGKINEYLFEGDLVEIKSITKPLSMKKPIFIGSAPKNDGRLIIYKDEKDLLLKKYPDLDPYILKFVGAKELLQNLERYILNLQDASPSILNYKEIKQKLISVKEFRYSKGGKDMERLKDFPTLFQKNMYKNVPILIIPLVSSIRRRYIPCEIMDKKTMINDKAFQLLEPSLLDFVILSTRMHAVWLERIGGKLKSDYSYSNRLVYNNFILPSISNQKAEKLEIIGREIQRIRSKYYDIGDTLAKMYDPITMPVDLMLVHQKLDKEFEECYKKGGFHNDDERIEFLISLYKEVTKNG